MILSGFSAFSRAVAVAAVLAFGTVLAQPAVARDAPDSFADLVDKLLPTVVNITTTQNVPQQGAAPARHAAASAGLAVRGAVQGVLRPQGRRAAAAPRHVARLGLHHRRRRLHHHQQPRHPGRRGHHGDPARRHPAQGQADRLGQPGRHRRAQGRAAQQEAAAGRQVRRFRQEPGRRLGDRDRQSVRPRPFGDRRHHLGARPRAVGFARRLPADRRRHQQGQLGRSAVQRRRRGRSASTRRSTRRRAPTPVSPSRSRRTWSSRSPSSCASSARCGAAGSASATRA